MMVIRPDSVRDNLEEQKIYIFTDNYLDNKRSMHCTMTADFSYLKKAFEK